MLPDGMSYRVLVLPQAETMTPALLRKIKELVEAGATVMAPSRPLKSPSLSDYPRCDAEVKKLADELWAGGKLTGGKSAAEVLAARGVPPDFAADRLMRYTHRRIGESDVYFVANGTPQTFESVCSFRVTGKQPELWHPETGEIAALPAFQEKGGVTRVPLRFGPTESVFVVFRKPSDEPADRIVSFTRDGQELLRFEPAAKPGSPAAAESRAPAVDLVARRSVAVGQVRGQDGRRQRPRVHRRAARPADNRRAVGSRVSPGRRRARKAHASTRLISWSQHGEPGVRYFSGTATYRKSVNVPAEMLAQASRLYLDLGRVQVMAEVKLNGKDLGILWKAAVPGGRHRCGQGRREPARGEGRQSLDQPADRRRATAGGQQPQRQRHAEGVAAMVAGRQAQPDRPLHLHHLAAVEEELGPGRIRPVRPRDAAAGGEAIIGVLHHAG